MFSDFFCPFAIILYEISRKPNNQPNLDLKLNLSNSAVVVLGFVTLLQVFDGLILKFKLTVGEPIPFVKYVKLFPQISTDRFRFAIEIH